MAKSVQERIRHALEDLENRVTIGFEVETQMEKREPEVDYDAMREHACECVDTYDVCRAAGVPHDMRWISALDCSGDAERLADLIGVDWSELIDDYVEEMDTENWLVESKDDFYDLGHDVVRHCPEFTFEEDGSVSGPEFQSPILSGRNAAIAAAEKLFAQISHQSALYVDEECSCHIHLRMQDVFHTGCNALQQLIFEELFNDLNALPECIKTRLEATPRWIQPTNKEHETCKTKYNPVQCHSLGTWEFRLFGNVSSTNDFIKCLDAAIAAMRRAYTRYLEGNYTVQESSVWVHAAAKAMYNWEPIQEFYPQTVTESTTETETNTESAAAPILAQL
jgi:hypothetical protein